MPADPQDLTPELLIPDRSAAVRYLATWLALPGAGLIALGQAVGRPWVTVVGGVLFFGLAFTADVQRRGIARRLCGSRTEMLRPAALLQQVYWAMLSPRVVAHAWRLARSS